MTKLKKVTPFLLFLIYVVFGLQGCALKTGFWGSTTYGEHNEKCRNGEAFSCWTLGEMEKRANRLDHSAYYYEAACTLGDVRSCDELLRVRYINRDVEGFVIDLENKCRYQNDFHCALLSRHYFNLGDLSGAIDKQRAGCRGNDLRSCLLLSQIYSYQGDRESLVEQDQRSCQVATQVFHHEIFTDINEQKRVEGFRTCLISGLRSFTEGRIVEAMSFYAMGCELAPLSGRQLTERERLYQMLSCSRAAALDLSSAEVGYNFEQSRRWLEVSTEFLRSRCLLQTSSSPAEDCYDLSALKSLQGELQGSLRFLRRAFRDGDPNWSHIERDAEMNFLINSNEYNEFKQGMSF